MTLPPARIPKLHPDDPYLKWADVTLEFLHCLFDTKDPDELAKITPQKKKPEVEKKKRKVKAKSRKIKTDMKSKKEQIKEMIKTDVKSKEEQAEEIPLPFDADALLNAKIFQDTRKMVEDFGPLHI